MIEGKEATNQTTNEHCAGHAKATAQTAVKTTAVPAGMAGKKPTGAPDVAGRAALGSVAWVQSRSRFWRMAAT